MALTSLYWEIFEILALVVRYFVSTLFIHYKQLFILKLNNKTRHIITFTNFNGIVDQTNKYRPLLEIYVVPDIILHEDDLEHPVVAAPFNPLPPAVT